MNKFSRKGFTLIELIVVVLILGILASIGMPYYYKTIETSKANAAVAIGHLLGNSNRMWNLDRGSFASGQITDACNDSTPCSTSNTACNLVRCNYVAKQDWEQSGGSAYLYYVCNGGAGGSCCNAGIVSCIVRRSGAPDPYSSWGYKFSDSGKCDILVTNKETPECPKF